MMTKDADKNRMQIQYFCMNDLVPEDHLLRLIEEAIDWGFIYDLVEDKYCPDWGRPSMDPVTLIKIPFIQYLYGIRSMRQTIKEIEVNVAYRWFLGLDMYDPVPHFTTFGKNYTRRFKDTDLFEQIFSRILEECYKHGFVDPSEVFVDATHVKACANIHKKEKGIAKQEALWFHKGEHKQVFAYTIGTACDKNGWILNYTVNPGNLHDSRTFKGLYDKIRNIGIEKLIADAGYKTPAIAKLLLDDGITPVFPYHSPMTKEGFFRKHEYVYDEYYDCYICPADKTIPYSTTNRDGYREYKSNPKECVNCPYLTQCTLSANHQKTITRHIWEPYMEMCEDIRHTLGMKDLYSHRKETIERLFGTAKEAHGFRYTQMKGKARMRMKAGLTYACMNLKKLAKMLRRIGKIGPGGTKYKTDISFAIA